MEFIAELLIFSIAYGIVFAIMSAVWKHLLNRRRMGGNERYHIKFPKNLLEFIVVISVITIILNVIEHVLIVGGLAAFINSLFVYTIDTYIYKGS